MRLPIRTILTAVLAAAATLAVQAEAPPDAATIDRLVRERKLDEAVEAGRSAVLARPNDPDLRKSLAAALSTKARTLQQVVNVAVGKETVEAGDLRMVVPASGGKLAVGYDAPLFEEAMVHLGEAIRRAPARKDLRLAQIYLLTDAARVDRAKRALDEALAVLPKDDATARDLAAFGAERMKRDDTEGAATLFAPVAAAFPTNAAVQADLGFALTKLGRKSAALAAFDRAAAAAPRDAGILRMRGTAAMLFRDFSRARSAYEEAFLAGRQDVDRVGAAAAAYGLDPATAAPDFEDLAAPSSSSDPAAVDIASGFLAAVRSGRASVEAMRLAQSLLDGGQPLLAIPVLEQAMTEKPGPKDARALRKKAYDDLGFGTLVAGR